MQFEDANLDTNIITHVQNIIDPVLRKQALNELSKLRENNNDLACYIWYSYGTIAAILSEIIATYPLIINQVITQAQSQYVCSCLTILQCVASHPETKHAFMKAHIPLYIYPFLNMPSSNSKAIEFLRLTALGVLGALVKGVDPEVLEFLLQSEIIPLCLIIMETCSDLPRTVSTFIIQKILSYEEGLAYICSTAEKYYAVTSVLARIIEKLGTNLSPRLFKHILRCYLRFTEYPNNKENLTAVLPKKLLTALDTGCFDYLIKEDPTIKDFLETLQLHLNKE